jgi:glycosyltransferase involved in cell wall biosynthesis
LFRVPRADVYYVHSYEYLPVPLVTGRNARVIYDAHDFYRDMYPQEMLSELVSRYLRPSLARLETAMARRCDAVVTVSHGVAKAIEEAMSVRPHVIPNAFDRRMNTQTSCDIRARIGLAPDRILLVIAGNNKSETRFDYITALLTGLPTHVHIAFVGRGYEASDENMRQSDMRDRLHFIPAVPPFEITSFIASADAGLLLYRPISITFKNSLPNRFFHFLDAGLPIVRFALPEVERVIGDAPVGPILDPRNPIQSAKILAAFVADVDARRVAAAAAKALGETITWAAQEHALRAIIEPQASASS